MSVRTRFPRPAVVVAGEGATVLVAVERAPAGAVTARLVAVAERSVSRRTAIVLTAGASAVAAVTAVEGSVTRAAIVRTPARGLIPVGARSPSFEAAGAAVITAVERTSPGTTVITAVERTSACGAVVVAVERTSPGTTIITAVERTSACGAVVVAVERTRTAPLEATGAAVVPVSALERTPTRAPAIPIAVERTPPVATIATLERTPTRTPVTPVTIERTTLATAVEGVAAGATVLTLAVERAATVITATGSLGTPAATVIVATRAVAPTGRPGATGAVALESVVIPPPRAAALGLAAARPVLSIAGGATILASPLEAAIAVVVPAPAGAALPVSASRPFRAAALGPPAAPATVGGMTTLVLFTHRPSLPPSLAGSKETATRGPNRRAGTAGGPPPPDPATPHRAQIGSGRTNASPLAIPAFVFALLAPQLLMGGKRGIHPGAPVTPCAGVIEPHPARWSEGNRKGVDMGVPPKPRGFWGHCHPSSQPSGLGGVFGGVLLSHTLPCAVPSAL